MAKENLYKWTDNPTVSGVAKCDTDVLNDCLMHLKYENDDFVSKSGDTMTGNLHIKNTTPFVSLINSDFDKTNTETLSANKTLSYLRTRDKNNIDFFSLANTYMANGNVQSTWNVGRTVDGSNKTTSISIGVTPTGDVYTYAPTPATGDNSTKIATTAYCVNMATTTAPTTTSSASKTRPAWVIENYVNGTSGYRIWSDKFCEQWGRLTPPAATGTVTLTKKMKDANYQIHLQCYWTNQSSSTSTNSQIVRNISASSFDYASPNTYTSVLWKVSGYIA